MTAAALTPSVEYIEDGVTLLFPVPFRFLAATHLEVKRITAAGVVSTLAHGSAWSATGGTSDVGGTVTLVASVAGSQLKIRRVTPRSQQTDYQTNDTFPAETHEAALDKLTLTDQEQDVKIADTAIRSLQVPEGETAAELPAAAVRANKYPVFDADGNISLSSGTGVDAGLRGDLALKAARDLVGGQIYPASTRAIMAGLNPNAFEQAFLTEGERHGIFEWKAGNFSAFVNIDPAQGVYVPPASDPTGASGVWRRRTDGNDVRPEWFGAIGNYQSATNTGFDDTAGIQAALDFASLTGLSSVAGGGPIARVLLSAKNYLTGNISVRWISQIYGTSRVASTAVFAKDGTAGVFWGVDDDESPQKVVMRDFALYGRGLGTITHMLKLDSAAPAVGSGQHGTEGGLYDLWIRDAPEATALQLNGNVSYFHNITLQSCKRGLVTLGAGNKGHTIVLMQIGEEAADKSDAYALDISGTHLFNVHVEAPGGDVPVRMFRGDCTINGFTLSPAPASVYDHLFEVDETYLSWVIRDIQVYVPGNITITTAIMRIGFVGFPGTFSSKLGTDINRVIGRDLSRNEVLGLKFMGGAKYQAFKVRINNDAGTIKYSISPAKLSAGSPIAEFISRVVGATTSPQPLGNSFGGFGMAYDQDSGNANRIMFNTADQAIEPLAHIASVNIDLNKSAYADLKAAPGVYSVTAVDLGARERPVIDFFTSGLTKADLTVAGALPTSGDLIQLTITGWFA